MRCRQAKQKLNSINFDSSEIAKNQMLLNHLNECSACASLVTAENSLQADLQAAAVDDNEEVVSNWFLKTLVERQAADANRSKFRENHLMAIFNLFKNQSKLTIGVTTVAVVLLLSVLIPFSYNKTIGYEVAFAGVDKNLALDPGKIQTLLARLGIENVDIDVSGCEATCNVKISDLKSPDDAKLVVAAFNEIDHVVVLEEITEMIESESGNIFEKIIVQMNAGDRDLMFISDDASDALIERLGNNPEKEILIWIAKDTLEFYNDTLICDSIFITQSSGDSVCSYFNIIDTDIEAVIDENGTITITINPSAEEEQVLTLLNGEIDDETRALLEKLGLSVSIMSFGDGSDMLMLSNNPRLFVDDNGDTTMCSDSKSVTIMPADADDSDSAAKVIGELPYQFELSQNYPNPFNPTTTINFSIPTGQHVSLEIINVKGQVVKTLINQQMSAGSHSIDWDATNESGSKTASGIYLYKLVTDDDADVKKMTLLK